MKSKILVIEDTEFHWERLNQFLAGTYKVYPESKVKFDSFLSHIETLIHYYKNDIDSDSEFLESKNLVISTIDEFSPNLLILDAALSGNDLKSGHSFLKALRTSFPYLPILILSAHSFEYLEQNNFFSENPNYYLSKDEVGISQDMVEKRLIPVINLLLRLNTIPKNMVQFVEKGFQGIHDSLSGLETSIANIMENTTFTRQSVEILIRVAQYDIGKNDKKAKELVDDLIDGAQMSLGEISIPQQNFLESISNMKAELIAAFKDDASGEIINITKKYISGWIGESDEKSLAELSFKLVGKSLAKAYKVYRTGEA